LFPSVVFGIDAEQKISTMFFTARGWEQQASLPAHSKYWIHEGLTAASISFKGEAREPTNSFTPSSSIALSCVIGGEKFGD